MQDTCRTHAGHTQVGREQNKQKLKPAMYTSFMYLIQSAVDEVHINYGNIHVFCRVHPLHVTGVSALDDSTESTDTISSVCR